MYSAYALSVAFVTGRILDRFTLGLHLVFAPCQCSCWCGCEGTGHAGIAFYCVVGAVVGIALGHSSLRAWRFFRRAGARGSRMTESSVEKEPEIVAWTPVTASLEDTERAESSVRPSFLVWSPLSPAEYRVFHPRPPSPSWSKQTRSLLGTSSCRRFASAESQLASLVVSASSSRGAYRYALVARRAAAIQTHDRQVFFGKDARLTQVYSDLLPQGDPIASAEDVPGGTATPTEFPGLRKQ